MEEGTNMKSRSRHQDRGPLTISSLAPSGRRPLNSLVHEDERARDLVDDLIRYNPDMANLLAEIVA